MKSRAEQFNFRKLRVRRKIYGSGNRLRLSVYRSLKHIYAQIINDLEGRTVVAASSKDKSVGGLSGIKAASKVGELLGKKAVEKGVQQVVFDRGARPFHGRVKALAEAARQSGLKF